jgi:isoleucyl-tRNA synthetase
MLCHVDGAGKFTSEVAGVVGSVAKEALIGQEVLKGGSKAILQLLKEIGCLVNVEKIKHRYPYDWKTNEPVIMMLVTEPFSYLLWMIYIFL